MLFAGGGVGAVNPSLALRKWQKIRLTNDLESAEATNT
jgi:hypothetical protein